MKTLKLRIRDKHADQLNRLSGAVNFVWNYVNDLSYKHLKKIKRDFVSSGERTRKRLNQEKKFFWGYGLRYVSEDLAEWYGKANQRM